jgi:pimeloyl-ACP methyl ester carboxylesterase
MTTREGYLEVPGAKLFYRISGSGPILLTLQGGGGEAEGSNGLAEVLGDRYSVVSYDRRGLSRSSIDDATAPIEIATHTDDASRLLAALGEKPAYVFGCSLGALIGLDLVATHADKVRLLVAHEPPVPDLLAEPERTEWKERQREVDATFEREGLRPAMQKFLALAGGVGNDPEPEVNARPSHEQMAQRSANLQFHLAHDAPAAHRHQLDIDRLRCVSQRIVPAAGQLSRDLLPYRGAQSLAQLLGRGLHEFPGNHVGYVARPRAFGEELHRVLLAGG